MQRLQSAVTLYRENKSKPQSLYDCRSGSQSLLVSNHRWGLVTTFYSVWNYTVCESWGALLTKLWVLLLSQVTILAACTLHIYMYSAGIRTMIYIYIYIYRAFVSSGMVQLMLVLTDTLFCGWICMRYWPRFEGLNFGTKHCVYYYYYYYYYYYATFQISILTPELVIRSTRLNYFRHLPISTSTAVPTFHHQNWRA